MKKFFTLKNILLCVAAVLGLIAIFMIFAPAIAPKKELANLGAESTAGSVIAFGNKDKGAAASAYIIAFLLPIIGLALTVVAFLGKGGKIVPIAAAACFLLGGIFYFLPMALYQPYIDEAAKKLMSSNQLSEYVKNAREGLKKIGGLGGGAIVGGIFSIISALAACATLFVDKLTK